MARALAALGAGGATRKGSPSERNLACPIAACKCTPPLCEYALLPCTCARCSCSPPADSVRLLALYQTCCRRLGVCLPVQHSDVPPAVRATHSLSTVDALCTLLQLILMYLSFNSCQCPPRELWRQVYRRTGVSGDDVARKPSVDRLLEQVAFRFRRKGLVGKTATIKYFRSV